jgi:hypothetical protein
VAGPKRPDAPSPKGGGKKSDRGVRYATTLTVDGVAVDLKEFLHDVLGGAVAGLVEGLRGVDAPKTIDLRVERL